VRFGKTIPLQFTSRHVRRAHRDELATSSLGEHTWAALAAYSESLSVLALRTKGQESGGGSLQRGEK